MHGWILFWLPRLKQNGNKVHLTMHGRKLPHLIGNYIIAKACKLNMEEVKKKDSKQALTCS
jgi:predicted SpoU family rRNA methylase